MRTIKRMAALLLAVVLVLSCLPAASVFATELPEETVPAVTEAADTPTTGTDPPVTVETQPREITGTAETTAPTAPEETTAPTVPPETTEPEETNPTEGTTEPTGETTAPTEVPTASTGETTAPTEAPTVPTDETMAPTEAPTVPTDEATSPTETPTEPTEEATEPTAPEPSELYRAVTEDGTVTAVLFGTAEEGEADSFQVTALEATEELVDSLATELSTYTGISYAPLAVLPFQVGFPTGGIQGSFTLTLTLPGERLPGNVFVFQTQEDGTRLVPDAAATNDGKTVTVTVPLTRLDSTVFTVATAEPVSVDGGSSGSGLGPGGATTFPSGGTPGKGKNLGIGVGVTMQVVYFKYKDCWNRKNSYQCVVDALQEIENNPHPPMNESGTVLSNTVLDGFTWVQRDTFWYSMELGMGTLRSYGGTDSERSMDPDVKNYITHIILGPGHGAWNKESVGADASLYTKVLRELGVPEDKIQNYLRSFGDGLNLDSDGDLLIPTIIWAWYGQENIAGSGYHDTLCGPILSYRLFDYRGERWRAEQVLKSGYSSPAQFCRDSVDCYWCTNSTEATTCCLLYGDHSCNGPSGYYFVNSHPYTQDFYGTGFVNRINANGVDANDGPYYYMRGYWTPYGKVNETIPQPVTLKKSINASAECIAQIQDNAMYTLAGAKYNVIVGGQVVDTITTDASGNAVTTKKFNPGTTGTVVEIVAPKGFRLDSTPVPFTVPTSGACVVNVSDVPIMDPPFAITKVDKDTTNPQGNGSFSGAVFRFEYFDNDSWSGTAKRTWYFQTDADGWARYNPSFLAPGYSSDALYVDSHGMNQVPLGTMKITEIKNSLGYIVLPKSLYVSIVEDSTASEGAKFVWATESWDILVDMASGNFGVYEPIDTSVMGSLTIQKKDKDFGTTAPTWATLAGCEFTVYNRSANPVKIGETIVQPGESCTVLTVDAAGQAATGNIFPVGSYEVKETKGNDFYQCNTEWSYTFTVTGTENHPTFTAECANTMKPAALHLTKVDPESNPLVGSKFCLEWSQDGITWQPVTKADDIIMGGCASPELDEKGCLTVGADGTISFTGLYPVLHYRITEVETPNGYQLLKDPILVEQLLPENNFENSFRVVNNDMFTLPKTGGNGFSMLTAAVITLALSCAAILTVLFSERKRR